MEEQITVRLLGSHLVALDDMRRKEADIPGRAEMVRRLIERAGAK